VLIIHISLVNSTETETQVKAMRCDGKGKGKGVCHLKFIKIKESTGSSRNQVLGGRNRYTLLLF